mmetsp:Transcript_49777/g.131989  ORF Transcript_49777/g.131989 Transcript_49777/m.131989 type:complete len:255 (+) Transcript_49777:255-1019(+)
MSPVEGVVVVRHDVPLDYLSVHDRVGGWQQHWILHNIRHDGVQVVVWNIHGGESGLLCSGQRIELLYETFEIREHIPSDHVLSSEDLKGLLKGLGTVAAAIFSDHLLNTVLVFSADKHKHFSDHLKQLLRLEVELLEVPTALAPLEFQAPRPNKTVEASVQAIVQKLLQNVELAHNDTGSLACYAPECSDRTVAHPHVRSAMLLWVRPAAAIEVATISCLLVLGKLSTRRASERRISTLTHKLTYLHERVQTLL